MLDDLVRHRGPALLRYGYLLTGSTTDAQDLVQDAIVRVLTRRPRLRATATLETYVRRTMLTLAVDAGRRTHRWQQLRHLVVEPEVAPDEHGPAESRHVLDQALATLSPRQRVCVVLRYLEDMAVPEIADLLDLSQGAVKRYLFDAVRRLGPALGPLDEPDPVVPVHAVTTGRGA